MIDLFPECKHNRLIETIFHFPFKLNTLHTKLNVKCATRHDFLKFALGNNNVMRTKKKWQTILWLKTDPVGFLLRNRLNTYLLGYYYY